MLVGTTFFSNVLAPNCAITVVSGLDGTILTNAAPADMQAAPALTLAETFQYAGANPADYRGNYWILLDISATPDPLDGTKIINATPSVGDIVTVVSADLPMFVGVWEVLSVPKASEYFQTVTIGVKSSNIAPPQTLISIFVSGDYYNIIAPFPVVQLV